MLRALVGPHHDNWDQLHTCIEFAYKESQQASTGYSPSFLEYGLDPSSPLSLAAPRSAPSNESADSAANSSE